MTRIGRTTWLLLAACLPAAIACALGPAAAPPPASAPASQPAAASAPAAEVQSPDRVKDALAYDEVEEQVRFAVACGYKRELSEPAFEDNRGRHHPFVRRFDRWDQIVLFDRNGNGTISWAEAAQYRAALRKALRAAYDADRDGLLTGDERAAANGALAEGKLPPLAPPAPRPSPAATQPAPTSGPADSATHPDGLDE